MDENTKTEVLTWQTTISGFDFMKLTSRIWTLIHFIIFSSEQRRFPRLKNLFIDPLPSVWTGHLPAEE
jgi:hypothetical protein